MNNRSVFLCILILVVIFISGCTTFTPPSNTSGITRDTDKNTPQSDTSPPTQFTPFPNASENAAVNTSAIPLLLTEADWQMAEGCGWTIENISESAALFKSNCQVRNLLGDGWNIVGMGYDMNIIGSRCRMSTHPGAAGSCDWCLDAGPTLALRYKGMMTSEFLANMKTETVTLYRTDMPEGTGSISRNNSDTIVYRNGTALYTFRPC